MRSLILYDYTMRCTAFCKSSNLHIPACVGAIASPAVIIDMQLCICSSTPTMGVGVVLPHHVRWHIRRVPARAQHFLPLDFGLHGCQLTVAETVASSMSTIPSSSMWPHFCFFIDYRENIALPCMRRELPLSFCSDRLPFSNARHAKQNDRIAPAHMM